MWNIPRADWKSANIKVGQQLSAITVIEHEQGLVSKHFFGPDSSLMRVLTDWIDGPGAVQWHLLTMLHD